MINQIELDARKVHSQVDLTYFKNKKILVTGASGIIGANFLSVLALQNESQNRPEYIHAVTKTGKFPITLSNSVTSPASNRCSPIGTTQSVAGGGIFVS